MSTFSTTSSTSSSYTGRAERVRSSRSRHRRQHHEANDIIESLSAAQERHSESTRFRGEPLDGARVRLYGADDVFGPVEFGPASRRRGDRLISGTMRHSERPLRHRSRSRHSSHRETYEDEFFSPSFEFEPTHSTGWDPKWNLTISAQVRQ